MSKQQFCSHLTKMLQNNWVKKNDQLSKKILCTLEKFTKNPSFYKVSSLLNWTASDLCNFSEKLNDSLIERISKLFVDSSLFKIKHFSIPPTVKKLEDIFLYDLQAPGTHESYFLLGKFGLLRHLANTLETQEHVGLSGPKLTGYNKYFLDNNYQEIKSLRQNRLSLLKILSIKSIRYEIPTNIDEILANLKQKKSIFNLIEGEAAQVFGWKSFKSDIEKRKIARKYFVTQIVEMLRFCSENKGKICIHFGPESECPWDKVISVILQEQQWQLFGIDSIQAGFFAIHYPLSYVNGKAILPYSPRDHNTVPLIHDLKHSIKQKLLLYTKNDRKKLLIELKFLLDASKFSDGNIKASIYQIMDEIYKLDSF